jgi:hypothetical protein
MPSHTHRITRIFGFAVLLFTFVALACNSPLSSVNESAVGTSAAQTITAEYARQTETAAAGPTKTSTLIPTQALASATNTLPPVATQPPVDTPVPVPSAITIVASEDTNCREGPAPEYARLGFLLKDQQSTVVGRNSQNTWWYIENPRKPGEYCWVWGQTTRVSGDTSLLAVITPPPPPVAQNPDFSAFFVDINSCGGPAAIFEIQNTGDATFKSMELTIDDRTLDETVHDSSRNSPFFPSPGGCPGGGQNLEPGAVKYIGGVVEDFVNSGDQGVAHIVLCTETGLGGDCLDTNVSFFFP